jgi:hypothetical protein
LKRERGKLAVGSWRSLAVEKGKREVKGISNATTHPAARVSEWIELDKNLT